MSMIQSLIWHSTQVYKTLAHTSLHFDPSVNIYFLLKLILLTTIIQAAWLFFYINSFLLVTSIGEWYIRVINDVNVFLSKASESNNLIPLSKDRTALL